jgi:hypothetical protein
MNALVSFVAGEALAQSVGVSDTSDRQYCGLMMMIGGLTPLGALLTRQVALARVPEPPALATNAGGASPGTGTGTGSGNCTGGDTGKAAGTPAGTPDSPGKTG